MNGKLTPESDIAMVVPTSQPSATTVPPLLRPQDFLNSSGGALLQQNTLSPSQPQLPQALQNLQRILQSQLGNVNSLHLQRALQKQQVYSF